MENILNKKKINEKTQNGDTSTVLTFHTDEITIDAKNNKYINYQSTIDNLFNNFMILPLLQFSVIQNLN